jgi:thiol-disulfide isomerase/thioredoxin
LLPTEDPPPGAESQFSTDFDKHSIPYSEILSGGPPKDGIPAIDEPQFVTVDAADDWLEAQEPVVLVQIEDDAHAYPVQILMWHEIVNSTVGQVPVSVTYCPLCNTAIVFERILDGQVLDFGTTGRLRNSNLIMYDRQTETWWQQATGESIVGEYTGRQLAFVPASIISWTDFKTTYPEGAVLSRETGYARDYGRNPYAGYDDINGYPFLFDGRVEDGVLPPMARVLTVDLNGETVAYPYDVLENMRAVNDTVGGDPIVVLWASGTASALDAGSVAGGRDVGTATTFSRELDGQTLTFALDGGQIVDEQSNSEWNVLGQAIAGPLAGQVLAPVVSINHFWFSWMAFKPDTRIYEAKQATTKVSPPVPETVNVELDSDLEIVVYQGEDILGGQTVRLSEILAQGKPVVLNMWAGLCPICRAEMPGLQRAYEKYEESVLIIGVDIGPFVGLGSEADARALLGELGITFPAGTTPDVSVLRDYQILGTPTTIFFQPDGEIVQQWSGRLTEVQLDEAIQALLQISRGS